MEKARDDGPPVRPQLGLFDAVAIIVGIVIGSTIYKSPQLIMANVPSPGWGLAAWGLGGLLSFVGALCYAELATTYPRSGGDYVYLTRAFGSWAGFLFGWAQLAVLLTASIGAMAFVFGDYAVKVWTPPDTVVPQELRDEEAKVLEAQKNNRARQMDTTVVEVQRVQGEIKVYDRRRELWTALFGAAAVGVLTLTNVLGVVLGKWTQNLLSILKVIGLGAVAYAGFQYGQADVLTMRAAPPKDPSFGLAMIFVLYAYGGWNDSAFVAAEVRNRRNIVRSLLLGIVLITAVYLTVNVAYLRALGFEGVQGSRTVAADAVAKAPFGVDAAKAVSVLVMVSALGAINGLIFTGSRLYSTLGAGHSVFALLGRWSPRLGSPVWALLIQAAITGGMIAAVATPVGRDTIDQGLKYCLLEPIPWDKFDGGFGALVSGSSPVFWGFFLLSGLSLFALRQRDPRLERPFKVPLYPYLPLVFCGTCFYMLYSAIDYAKYVSLIGVVPLLLGLPLYALSRRTGTGNDVAELSPTHHGVSVRGGTTDVP